jgi:hypothetical protein
MNCPSVTTLDLSLTAARVQKGAPSSCPAPKLQELVADAGISRSRDVLG